MNSSPLLFLETARIEPRTTPITSSPAIEILAGDNASLNLDKLPDGIVSGNTLMDYSATSEGLRSGLSLALAFASRAALAEMGKDANEDDWFAAYKTNLSRLGFNVSPGAFMKSSFKKRGLAVHQAIIPFLTAALGGAGVGPVLLSLLHNLKQIDESRPWVALFDQETRIFTTREMHFAAVGGDGVESKMRHVAMRLYFVEKQSNVLFFRINNMSADFESATTMLSIDNGLLAILEPALRARFNSSITDFVKAAEI